MSDTISELKFKPYARLLTMLGDQLIKNERVALVEVIKNSYDADASWVLVCFENFKPGFIATADSRIVIEDNGFGMTEEVIRKHWVNPATPVKLLGKKDRPKTPAGRTIQGEKGIGRFALLKIGRHISFTTRAQGSDREQTLTLDLSEYNDDFIEGEGDDRKAVFLEEIRLDLSVSSEPSVIVRKSIDLGSRKVMREAHGTRIVISHLKSSWDEQKVSLIFDDLSRLQSIFDTPPIDAEHESEGSQGKQKPGDPLPFEVDFYLNDEYQLFAQAKRSQLDVLMTESAALKVEDGRFDAETMSFTFKLDGQNQTLELSDPDVRGLALFRRNFGPGGEQLAGRKVQCGSFGFAFFAFDFSADAKGKHQLDSSDRDLIREHRIYLYRDGIRVYPYGDATDDWLGIDIYRGTVRASEFLSNDQVIGYVTISQQENPKLIDKTSREGLIDQDFATEDFRKLLQVFLAWVRKRPYEAYRQRVKTVAQFEGIKKGEVTNLLNEAWEIAQQVAPPDVREKLVQAARLYKVERDYLVHRAETTEHLAGVGLSVETASHDLMVAMKRSLSVIDALVTETDRQGPLDKAKVRRDLTMLRGSLSFIESQLKDIQLLFKSTKQRRKDIRVADMLDKVVRLFQPALKRADVQLHVDQTQVPLVAKTTDAVLLQVFLNLFDNAVYWLETKEGDRNISIRLDGDANTLVFADDGPGIRDDDAPFLFDAFYSGKGQEGRGLGLYIARQLLERHDYSIALVTEAKEKLLKGANFQVTFIREDA